MKPRMAIETYIILIINIWFALIVARSHWNIAIIQQLGAVSGGMPTAQSWVDLIPISHNQSVQLIESFPIIGTTLSGIPLFLMRTLNASFLHFSWSHLFGNLISLLIIGKQYEKTNYRSTFLIVYVVTGIISMASAALLQPNAITAGASGAVFGLMGASFILSKRAHQLAIKGQLPHYHIANYARLGKLVYSLMIYNLITTFIVPGISIVGHISGLIAGLCIGIIIPVKDW